MVRSDGGTRRSSGWLTLINNTGAQLHRLPEWLRRYTVVFLALIVGTALAVVLLHTIGNKARFFISLLGDVVVLGAAWMGYGPGVLAIATIFFVVPYILKPGQPLQVDPGQISLFLIISLLVSRISS